MERQRRPILTYSISRQVWVGEPVRSMPIGLAQMERRQSVLRGTTIPKFGYCCLSDHVRYATNGMMGRTQNCLSKMCETSSCLELCSRIVNHNRGLHLFSLGHLCGCSSALLLLLLQYSISSRNGMVSSTETDRSVMRRSQLHR